MSTYVINSKGQPEIDKDPNAVLDYPFDWSAYLTECGSDTIASADFIIDGNATLVSQSNTDTEATAWISGGSVGEKIKLTCRITTAGGRTDDRTIVIKIKEL